MKWRPGALPTLPASVALLLLPLFAAPQQLSAINEGPSSISVPVGPTGHAVDSPHAQFRHTHPILDVKVASDDVSALATLALAGSGRAVRAPPAQTSPSAGLAPQLHARSLQDWEVEDFVLLATVDGTIHARDRKTGAPRWALEVPSSPMVESIYHRANRTQFDDSQPEDDFLWIVEPSRDVPAGRLHRRRVVGKWMV